MKNFFNRKNFIYTMILTLILLVFFLHKDFSNILKALWQASLPWLLIGVVSMLIFWILEALIYHSILKTYTSDISFGQMFKLTLATQFFNGITPFSTGGQPFQIYILNTQSKIGLGKLTSASVQNFIVYQLALVIYCLGALISHLFHPILLFGHYSTTILICGFILNILVIGFLFFVSTSQRFLRFVSTAGLNFLAKLHLIKDKDKSQKKLLAFTKSFSENMDLLKKEPRLLLKTLILNGLRLTAFYMVAYFVCRSLGLKNITMPEAILASSYTMLITSVVPLPGASAGAEFGFLVFFSSFIAGPLATAIMLLWRFITYYIGLILGFFVFFFGYKPAEQNIGS